MMIWIGLVAGNFIYQAFVGHDWAHAAEISFFQTVALIVYVLFEDLRKS